MPAQLVLLQFESSWKGNELFRRGKRKLRCLSAAISRKKHLQSHLGASFVSFVAPWCMRARKDSPLRHIGHKGRAEKAAENLSLLLIPGI